MNIEEITNTLREAEALKTELRQAISEPTMSETGSPWQIGGNYFIRTVTHSITGRVTAVTSTEIVVVDAAWIADTGRYMNAIETSEFAEVEPYPRGQEVIVGRGALIDSTTIPQLPDSQK